MKKTRRGLAVLFALVVAAICMCFPACGGSGLAGTYYFDSLQIETDGVVKEYRIGDDLPWGMVATKKTRTIKLKSDGTVVIGIQSASGKSREMEGTWKELEGEGDDLEITIDDEPKTGTCDGSTLTLREPSLAGVLILKK